MEPGPSESGDFFGGRCQVESMVSVDARGQMVLPKEVREKAGIEPGDKLVVATWQGDGSACCIFLMKADVLSSMLGTVLGPFMRALGSQAS